MDDDLIIFASPHKARVKGFCKYHQQYFGCELELERDRIPAQGYFVCLDCRKKRMVEREGRYTRKDGKPLRKRPKKMFRRFWRRRRNRICFTGK